MKQPKSMKVDDTEHVNRPDVHYMLTPQYARRQRRLSRQKRLKRLRRMELLSCLNGNKMV